MSQAPLRCDKNKEAAEAIYQRLIGLEQAGALPQSLNLDSGYWSLNYKDSDKPKEPKKTLEGENDGIVSCEEVWENGLQILDALGEKAGWEEATDKTQPDAQKEAVKRYQEFRKLIEYQTKRPIPWVLEAPHYGATLQQSKVAKGIRSKIKKSIQKLNELLAQENLSPAQRQQCLVACLWWFVSFGKEAGLPEQVAQFQKKERFSQKVIDRVCGEFSKYLMENGGGLGAAYLWPDAKFEATALTALIEKKGWCTERAKIMYAALRMAGIEAFFVEPRLSVEYFLAKDMLPSMPLLGHMASGVGVRVLDERGKEAIWIVDVALRLLEGDYVRATDQWKAHPYWELSLRHFYMADLANLGEDQINHGKYKAAERNFETALQMGEDSTAYHVMGNYAHLFGIKAEQLSCRLKDKRKICKNMDENIDKYSKEATAINPYDPVFQFNRGKFLLYKHDLASAVDALLQSMDADSRYILPYQKLRKVIDDILEYGPGEFSAVWNVFIEKMPGIVEKHGSLREVINERVENMKPRKKRHKKLSRKDEEIIKLIEELKRASKL